MNDTNKIRLIKAYTELVNVVIHNDKEELWIKNRGDAFKDIYDTMHHLSLEIRKLTFNEETNK